jgi:hypothetical protein
MSWGGYIPGDMIREMFIKGDIRKEAEPLHIDHDRLRGQYTDIEPRGDLLWAAIDLDGCLAEGIWTPDNPTSHIGYPIWRNVHKARDLEAAGYKNVIHTSRGWNDYENIEGWLNFYNVPFRRIVCGKLLAAIYIDDRARHSDDESWFPNKRSEGVDTTVAED